MARRRRRQKNNKHTVRDYVVFFVCAFVLIFLTSSFVIENVYNKAENIAVTPDGVKQIYLAAAGQINYGENSTVQTDNQSGASEDQSSGSEEQTAGESTEK